MTPTQSDLIRTVEAAVERLRDLGPLIESDAVGAQGRAADAIHDVARDLDLALLAARQRRASGGPL